MKVKVKRLHDDAVIPYKTYQQDFCYDVVATSREKIAPDVYRYGIGLAFEIDREDSNPFISINRMGSLNTAVPLQLSIDFRPRSSVWKTGLVLSNCEGTIDELYRGEVKAVFYHVLKSMPIYEIGDRIGQIKLGLSLPVDFELADSLSDTERNDGGFGSTGK